MLGQVFSLAYSFAIIGTAAPSRYDSQLPALPSHGLLKSRMTQKCHVPFGSDDGAGNCPAPTTGTWAALC